MMLRTTCSGRCSSHSEFVVSSFEPIGSTHFPALGTSCMFSRAWHQLHVFPCLAKAMCFSALACFGSCSNWFIMLFLLAVIGQNVTVIDS